MPWINRKNNTLVSTHYMVLWREFEFYIETSCDEVVVHHLTIEERKQYDHFLISYV